MENILVKNVKGLGYKHDTVAVKNGYGRNFLIPQGYGVLANATNKKVVAENIKQAAHKAEKLKTEAASNAAAISNANFEIKAKVGASGKIFGAVTTLMLSEALKAKGIDIDRKQIDFDSSVKEVGEYTATADLHKEIKAVVKFSVIAE